MDSFCKSMDLFCESMDWYHIMVMNPDSKKVQSVPYKMNPGFLSYRGSRILTLKILFQIVKHESSQFSKIQPVFTNLTNPHKSSHILSTTTQNKSLKIQICKSRILMNPDLQTCKSVFASLNFKDLYCGFNSKTFFLKICIVDSICKSKNLKLLNLFWFGRIHIWIPQP